MKKFYNALFILAIPAIFLVFTSETMYPTGSPGGKTGSPGDGGENCTDCHSGTAGFQEFWISSSMIATGYSPGQVYDIVVAGHDAGAARFGFEATAEKSDNSKVGTFVPDVLMRTQLTNNSSAITHTEAGSFPLADTATVWTFSWTAPSESAGDITFYAAVNAANGNGNSDGDLIFLTQFTASPSVGIGDNFASEDFRMYPNPTSGMVNIESNGLAENDEIEVVNLEGQIVKKIVAGNEKIRLDLSEMEKGVYFVRVGNETEKLLIQ